MAHSSTTKEWATGLLPDVTKCHERLRAADQWIASFARMQSIRQSVQNGQFLCGLAEKPARCLVAPHAEK